MTSKARQLAQTASAPEGRKNIVINGAMNVCQRATSKSGLGANTDSGYHVQDRFDLVLAGSTAGRFTMSQDTDAPSGFGAAMKLDCTTADTSIAADEFFAISYQIEGQDLQQLAKGTSDAKQLTVSFFAKANASKTYVVELKDHDNNRTCSQTYTVGTSYSRIELTFPVDTTGELDNDNARSFAIIFYFHVGSTYTSGTLQTAWGSQTTANRAVGCESIFSSTDNTFFMTGLQMEIGSVATEFEHRSFGEELELCQRYYQKTYPYSTAPGTATLSGIVGTTLRQSDQQTGFIEGDFQFTSRMRAAPTMTVYDRDGTSGKVNYYIGGSTTANFTATIVLIVDKGFSFFSDNSTTKGGVRFAYEADAEL
tara:strand:+ start:48 stop:1148 length:1101 start_codon:yes stop_codon:yes gene_type:complete